MAIREMRTDAAGLWKDYPHFLGPVREIEFHFQVELGCAVRFRGDFNGQGGGAFEVAVRLGARQLRGSDEARVRLQERVGRQFESSRNIELPELMLVDVGPESVAQVVP